VTHQHRDHNQIDKVVKKPSCTVIQEKDALKGGVYQNFEVSGISIQAVPAYNKNHPKEAAVGYLLTVDGIKIYGAGDTSTTMEMKELAKLELDYALLPIDGIYNMDPEEATACAEVIGAKHTIPIHTNPSILFDLAMAGKFTAKSRLIIEAGKEITL
jgi:L-ascorbate metabolism protein UlaG (beta-lactamase superfamily)